MTDWLKFFRPKLAKRQIVEVFYNITIYVSGIVSKQFHHRVKNKQVLEKVEH